MNQSDVVKPGRFALSAIASGVVLAFGSLGSTAAVAQDDDEATDLGTLKITGSRLNRSDFEGALPVTVITREEIDGAGEITVSDFLRNLTFNSFGSYRESSGNSFQGQALVSLRGLGSQRTLILLNGRRMPPSPVTQGGGIDLNTIPISAVERIELLSDGASAVYGSDAIGGVIQIFTRGGPDEGRRSYFELGGGSFDTYEAAAGVSDAGEHGWFSLNADVFDTGGIDSRTLFEPDDDGYRNLSVSGRGGLDLGAFGELRVNGLHADGESDFDGNPEFDSVNETETVQQVVGASWRVRPVEVVALTLEAGRSEDRSRNFRNGDFRSRFDTSRNDFSLQADTDVAEQRLSVGVDHLDERVDSTTQYDETRREITGVFAQLLGELGALDYRLAGRSDDYEAFGSQETGNVALGWQPVDRLRLRASYGTAFRAPSFNELFFPGFGNPDVQPEESQSTEIGAEWAAASWSLRLAAFETRIDDLIDTVQGPEGNFLPLNVAEARIRGAELSAEVDIADWQLSAAYTYQEPENRGDGANAGNRLRRRPDQILQLDADRSFGPLDAGLGIYAEGRRYEDAANSNRLPGYVLVDARLAYQLSAAWQVQGRVANLLDTDYETVPTYRQPGRAFYVTLRYAL